MIMNKKRNSNRTVVYFIRRHRKMSLLPRTPAHHSKRTSHTYGTTTPANPSHTTTPLSPNSHKQGRLSIPNSPNQKENVCSINLRLWMVCPLFPLCPNLFHKKFAAPSTASKCPAPSPTTKKNESHWLTRHPRLESSPTSNSDKELGGRGWFRQAVSGQELPDSPRTILSLRLVSLNSPPSLLF